jgi:tRNA-splicing ligase RtcB
MSRPRPSETQASLTMNRITRYLEEAPEEPTYGDFYLVSGEFGRLEVTTTVARRIAARLDRWIHGRAADGRSHAGAGAGEGGEGRSSSMGRRLTHSCTILTQTSRLSLVSRHDAHRHDHHPSSSMRIFGQHDEKTLVQFEHVRESAVNAALMADGHVGYVMPIGGVAAYRDQVSVVGVGFDIACGNAAIRTDLTLASLGRDPVEAQRTLTSLADEIAATVSFGIGRKNRSDDAPVAHELFDEPTWEAVPAKHRQALMVKARQQLGTVGSGNHYVDVFADESGTLWVGVHFGSRGFGHTVASSFLALRQGKGWGERVPETEVLLDLAQPIGHDYWHLMNLAGRYAYAGREWVARKVVSILGGTEQELVHNHHNFAWKEVHDGEEVVVIRKGATPAFPGQTGFIGGSMGDDAVIVCGRAADVATPEIETVQREALYSTVHGAGRVMSRTQAAGKRNRKTGRVLSPGLVTQEMMHGWVKEKGVILRGGGLDESPHAYRRLPQVLEAQEGTIEVLHVLRPLIVVMAGPDEFDPYKD